MRPVVDLRLDRADVLAEDADEQELHAAEEVDADEQRRQAKVERLPEHELQHEVDERDPQGQDREEKAGHHGQAQRYLGVVRDAEHGEVVQRVEVVLGDAVLALLLHVGDLDVLVAEVGDEPAEVRVRVVDLAQLVDHDPIVEAVAGEVLDERHVAQTVDEPVVETAHEEHRALLEALLLHGDHDLVALFPLGDELGDQLRRVLQIGRDRADRVATRLQQSVVGRAHMAEVAGVDDDLDARIMGAEVAQDGHRAVGGGVVDEDVLVVVARQRLEHLAHATIQLGDVVFLVVATGDDTDRGHAVPFVVIGSGGRDTGSRSARSAGTP